MSHLTTWIPLMNDFRIDRIASTHAETSASPPTVPCVAQAYKSKSVPSHRVPARVCFGRTRMMWGSVASIGRTYGRAGQLWPRLAVLSLLSWLALGGGYRGAAAPLPARPTDVRPVEAAFREAFQLWADERFEALWERGLLASRYRVSREAFVRGMRHRLLKPACCWGQIHTVQVHLQTPEEALVEAQIGIDVKTLGITVVRRMLVYLGREEGDWRVSLEDFLTKPEDGFNWLR
jgi:hypothetical protein